VIAKRKGILTTEGPIHFGSSPGMQELRKTVMLAARAEAPVLIRGETGTGKEVLARQIHLHSRRAHESFVKVNCAALSSELVESELFGDERGGKLGMFEVAAGGTLLLDEVGDMDLKVQAKLLQVLQDHEFQRLGGKETVRADVRVMAATHHDLEASIGSGKFRQDLYYRLNVMDLYIPPLRERKEDIIPLGEALLDKHVAEERLDVRPEITSTLRLALLGYNWPGNVRELENVVRKLIVIRDPDLVARDLMARSMTQTVAVQPTAPSPAKPEKAVDLSILDQVTRAQQHAEREAILAVLIATHWNRKRAAALLKINYKPLLYKMRKLNIDSRVVGQYARGLDITPENREQVLKILESTKQYLGGPPRLRQPVKALVTAR
jgi:transcriptional regulator with PAS, ATPase and Fis domain